MSELHDPTYFCLSSKAKELKKLGYKQIGKPFGDTGYKMYEFELNEELINYLDKEHNEKN